MKFRSLVHGLRLWEEQCGFELSFDLGFCCRFILCERAQVGKSALPLELFSFLNPKSVGVSQGTQ